MGIQAGDVVKIYLIKILILALITLVLATALIFGAVAVTNQLMCDITLGRYPVVKIRRLDISVLLNRMYRNSCFGGVDSAQKNHQDEACRCNQRLTVNNYRRGNIFIFPRLFPIFNEKYPCPLLFFCYLFCFLKKTAFSALLIFFRVHERCD